MFLALGDLDVVQVWLGSTQTGEEGLGVGAGQTHYPHCPGVLSSSGGSRQADDLLCLHHSGVTYNTVDYVARYNLLGL